MEADAAIERDQLAIEIVDHFDFRPRLREKDRQAAREWLAIASVPRDLREDVFQEAAFASRPADSRLYAERRIELDQGVELRSLRIIYMSIIARRRRMKGRASGRD